MQVVDNLSDGAIPIVGNPLGRLGAVSPALGVDKFQNAVWDFIPYWGLRTVRYRAEIYRQALVRSCLGEPVWINLLRSR